MIVLLDMFTAEPPRHIERWIDEDQVGFCPTKQGLKACMLKSVADEQFVPPKQPEVTHPNDMFDGGFVHRRVGRVVFWLGLVLLLDQHVDPR